MKIPTIRILPYQSHAEYWFNDFVRNNEKFIEKVDKRELTIYLKSGDVIIFMPESDYPRWCKGKVYKWGSKVYRSGYEVESVKEDG